MYAPIFYRERSVERMIAMARADCFGTFISFHSGRAFATHLPMLIEGTQLQDLRVLGHFAKANDQACLLRDGDEVLILFQGAHGYITPTWYRDEEDVPTYNYSAVHIRGIYKSLDSENDVRKILEMTVDHFERGSAKPWHIHDISPEVVEGFMKGVACFAVDVTSIEGARKHSQDKSAADQSAVLSGLEARQAIGDAELCAGMRASLGTLRSGT
jgi:transcriptional regulator